MNLFKKYFFPVLLGVVITIGVFVLSGGQQPEPETYVQFFTGGTSSVDRIQKETEPVVAVPNVAEKEKVRNGSAFPEASISAAGILAETNAERAALGLSLLSFNTQLTAAAQAKVADMISRQYFEHESPDGKGPGDLADAAGYEYLAVAENLALGDYENSGEIVEGWMDSPGHRENIVNTKYSDIGVAVGQGMFEGDVVWFAVQEFGRPASDCPRPSPLLEGRIEDSRRTLDETKDLLDEVFKEIEDAEPKSESAYNAKVDAYNNLVKSYNELIAETELLIQTYNNQVKEHNECVQ